MSSKKEILKYIRKLKKEFGENLPEKGSRPKAKSIHDLRLNLKKHKALLAMINKINKAAVPVKRNKSVKKLYASAGVVRDFQVQRKLLRKHGLPFNISLLKNNEFKALKKFSTKYRVVSHKKLTKAAYSKLEKELLLNDLTDEVTRAYIILLLKEIQGLLNSGDKESLHDARKAVKELMYNLGILRKTNPKAVPGKALDLRLDILQELLGEWHDLDVTIKLMDELGLDNTAKMKINQQKTSKEIEIESGTLLLNSFFVNL